MPSTDIAALRMPLFKVRRHCNYLRGMPKGRWPIFTVETVLKNDKFVKIKAGWGTPFTPFQKNPKSPLDLIWARRYCPALTCSHPVETSEQRTNRPGSSGCPLPPWDPLLPGVFLRALVRCEGSRTSARRHRRTYVRRSPGTVLCMSDHKASSANRA